MSYQEGKCIFCAGTGRIDREPCAICGGTGTVIEHIEEAEHADDPEPVRPV